MAHPIAGELVVVALKAEKLQHQAPGNQDPFCLFRVGDVVKRTKLDPGGGLYPIWDDQVNIPVAAGIHQMHVQIFDKDTNPKNLMGEGIIDLTKVLREKEHDGFFPLQYRGRQNCGDIYLELTFYSAQHTAARPQQQVRYQYPAGYVPGGGYQQRVQPSPQQYPPHVQPSPQQYPQHVQPPQPHYPSQPSQYPPQHVQPPQSQYPPQQQYPPQHRPPPVQQHRPHPSPQHRPPPMQSRPPPIQIQQHRPPQQQRPPMGQQRPMHHPLPPPPQHSPYPQPRPSASMGTQHFSPVMPSPQPLLSAAYNPAPSPGIRPNNAPYPNYPPGPPAGFHDHQQRPMGYPSRPPPHSNGYNQRPYPPY